MMQYRHFGRQGGRVDREQGCCYQRSVLIKDIKDPVMVLIQGLIVALLRGINKYSNIHVNSAEFGSTSGKPWRGALEDPGKISPFVIVSAKFGEQRILGMWRSPVQTIFSGVPAQPPRWFFPAL